MVNEDEMRDWVHRVAANRPGLVRSDTRVTEEVSAIAPYRFDASLRTTMEWRGIGMSCPSASLVCDSVSASKTKCGFTEFTSPSTPPKYYLEKVTTVTITGTGSTSGGYVGSQTELQDEVYDPASCVQTCDLDFSGSVSHYGGTPVFNDQGCTILSSTCGNPRYHSIAYNRDGSIASQADFSGTTTSFGPITVYYACLATNGTPSQTTTQTTSDLTSSGGGTFFGTSTVANATLSTEYTTALLKSTTIDALPAFDDDYNDSCSATYGLSTSETSFTLQRVKYKLTLSSPACAGMTVSWSYHFQPSPSGSPTNTAGPGFTASGGETEIGPFTIPDPTANGTTTITDIVVNCSECAT